MNQRPPCIHYILRVLFDQTIDGVHDVVEPTRLPTGGSAYGELIRFSWSTNIAVNQVSPFTLLPVTLAFILILLPLLLPLNSHSPFPELSALMSLCLPVTHTL